MIKSAALAWILNFENGQTNKFEIDRLEKANFIEWDGYEGDYKYTAAGMDLLALAWRS